MFISFHRSSRCVLETVTLFYSYFRKITTNILINEPSLAYTIFLKYTVFLFVHFKTSTCYVSLHGGERNSRMGIGIIGEVFLMRH